MKTILVVDDDPDYQMLYEMILKDAGYQITQALNGTQAIAALRADQPDVILLDVMMSTILEGIEISKYIKSEPSLKNIPVIMISSITTSKYASAFPDDERIPIEAWLSKPIQPDVLLKTIQRFVDTQEVAPNGR